MVQFSLPYNRDGRASVLYSSSKLICDLLRIPTEYTMQYIVKRNVTVKNTSLNTSLQACKQKKYTFLLKYSTNRPCSVERG
jgi:hypothetical protein